jgi:hypothetical protein
MGGYNHVDPLVPRLQKAAQYLYECGYEESSDAVEEVIAVLEGRLIVNPDGLLVAVDQPDSIPE